MANNMATYMKNVGKSVSYAAIDVIKERSGAIGEFAETNKELFIDVYANLRDHKLLLKKISTITKENKAYIALDEGLKALKEDITTGNFYGNAEREDRLTTAAGGDMMKMDDFDDDMDFNFDFDDDDDDESDAEVISRSNKDSATATSSVIVATTDTLVKTSRLNTQAQMQQSTLMFNNLSTGLNSMSGTIAEISSMVKPMITHAENSKIYFENSTTNMKTIVDILTRMDQRQASTYNEGVKEKKKEKMTLDDVITSEGAVDINSYLEVVQNNLKKQMGPTYDMLFGDTFGEDSNILLAFATKPLEFIPKFIVNSMIPQTLDKAFKSFDKSFGAFFSNTIARLNKLSNEDGIYKYIGNIFGIKNNTKTDIDTSNYNKGAIPFDGITKKAIVDVIPGHLRRIEKALTGDKTERIYDYSNGSWTTTDTIKQRFDREKEQNLNSAFSELDTYFKDREKDFIFDDIEDQKKYNKAKESIKKKIYDRGGSIRFNDNDDLFELEDSTLTEDHLKIFQKMMQQAPKEIMYELAGNVQKQRDNYRKRMEKYEEEGNTLFTNLFDNSLHKDDLKSKDSKIRDISPSSILFNSRDEKGKNVFYYLDNLLGELNTFRVDYTNNINTRVSEDIVNTTTVSTNTPTEPDSPVDNSAIDYRIPNMRAMTQTRDGMAGGDTVNVFNNDLLDRYEQYLLNRRNNTSTNNINTTIADIHRMSYGQYSESINRNKVSEYNTRHRDKERSDHEKMVERARSKGIAVINASDDKYRGDINQALDIRHNTQRIEDYQNVPEEETSGVQRYILEQQRNHEGTLRSVLGDFRNAADLGDKIDIMKSGIAKLVDKPAEFMTNMLTKADQKMYDVMFGEVTDNTKIDPRTGKPVKGFIGHAIFAVNNLFDKTADFIQDKILNKFGVDSLSELIDKGLDKIGLGSDFRQSMRDKWKEVTEPFAESFKAELKSLNEQFKKVATDAGDVIREDIFGMEHAESVEPSNIVRTTNSFDRDSSANTILEDMYIEGQLDEKGMNYYSERMSGNNNILDQSVFSNVNNFTDLDTVLRSFITDNNSILESSGFSDKIKSSTNSDFDNLFRNAGSNEIYSKISQLKNTYDTNKLILDPAYRKTDNSLESLISFLNLSENENEKTNIYNEIIRLNRDRFTNNRRTDRQNMYDDLFGQENIEDEIDQNAEGTKYVKKTGLTTISEGELIVPSELNPFNPNRHKTNKSKEIFDEKKVKSDFIKKLSDNMLMNASGGTIVAENDTLTSDVLTPNDLQDVDDDPNNYDGKPVKMFKDAMFRIVGSTEKDKEVFNNAISDSLNKFENYGPAMAAYGLVGTGVSLLSGAIGGPLLGAAVGSAIGLSKKSENFATLLYGDSIDGEKSRTGGIVSKDIQDFWHKHAGDMASHGLIGAGLSLFTPMGLIGGALMGATAGFSRKSETVQEFLFGKMGEDGERDESGLLPPDFKEKIKKSMPTVLAGLGLGIFTGPFGLLGNSMMGAGLGMVASTGKFQDFLFGKEIDGERSGGLTQALHESVFIPIKESLFEFKDAFIDFAKEDIFKPLKDFITPLTQSIRNTFSSITTSLVDSFTQITHKFLGIPLDETIKNWFLDPLVKTAQGFIKNLILKPAKHLISAPFKALGSIGTSMTKGMIKKGKASHMNAQERIDYMREHKSPLEWLGFNANLGYSRRSEDQRILDMSDEDLDQNIDKLGQMHKGRNYYEDQIKTKNQDMSARVVSYLKKNDSDGRLDWKTRNKFIKAAQNGNLDLARKHLNHRDWTKKGTKSLDMDKQNELFEMIKNDSISLRDLSKKRDLSKPENIKKGFSKSEDFKYLKMLEAESKFRSKNKVFKDVDDDTKELLNNDDKNTSKIVDAINKIVDTLYFINPNAAKRKLAYTTKSIEKRSDELENIENSDQTGGVVNDITDFSSNVTHTSLNLKNKISNSVKTKLHDVWNKDISDKEKNELNLNSISMDKFDERFIGRIDKDNALKEDKELKIKSLESEISSLYNKIDADDNILEASKNKLNSMKSDNSEYISMSKLVELQQKSLDKQNDQLELKRVELSTMFNVDKLVDSNGNLSKSEIDKIFIASRTAIRDMGAHLGNVGRNFGGIKKNEDYENSDGSTTKEVVTNEGHILNYKKATDGSWTAADRDTQKVLDAVKDTKRWRDSITENMGKFSGWFFNKSKEEEEEGSTQSWLSWLFGGLFNNKLTTAILPRAIAGATGLAMIGHIDIFWEEKVTPWWRNTAVPYLGDLLNNNPMLNNIWQAIKFIPESIGNAVKTGFQWFTGTGDYTGSGLPILFTDHLLPFYITGISRVFENVLPNVGKIIFSALPTLLTSLFKGIKGIFEGGISTSNFNQSFDDISNATMASFQKNESTNTDANNKIDELMPYSGNSSNGVSYNNDNIEPVGWGGVIPAAGDMVSSFYDTDVGEKTKTVALRNFANGLTGNSTSMTNKFSANVFTPIRSTVKNATNLVTVPSTISNKMGRVISNAAGNTSFAKNATNEVVDGVAKQVTRNATSEAVENVAKNTNYSSLLDADINRNNLALEYEKLFGLDNTNPVIYSRDEVLKTARNNIIGETTEQVTRNATSEAVENVAKNSNLITSIKSIASSAASKLKSLTSEVNTISKFIDKFSKVKKGWSTVLTSVFEVVQKGLIEAAEKIITDPALLARVSKSVLSTTWVGIAINATLFVTDFISAFDNARNYLDITEDPPVNIRIAVGAIYAGFGLIGAIPKLGAAILSIFLQVCFKSILTTIVKLIGSEEFINEWEEQKISAIDDVTEYNELNGTTLSIEEYNKINDPRWYQKISNAFKPAKEFMSNGINSAKTNISNAISTTAEKAEGAYNYAKFIGNWWSELLDDKIANPAKEWFNNWLTDTKNGWKELWGEWSTNTKTWWNNTKTWWSNWSTNTKTWWSDTTAPIRDWWSNWTSDTKAWWSDTTAPIRDWWTDTKNGWTELWSEWTSNLKEGKWLQDLSESISNCFNFAIDWVKDKWDNSTIGKGVNNLKSSAENVANSVSDFYNKIAYNAEGTPYVQKSGLTAISEGEMIIPSELNPMNPNNKNISSSDNGGFLDTIKTYFTSKNNMSSHTNTQLNNEIDIVDDINSSSSMSEYINKINKYNIANKDTPFVDNFSFKSSGDPVLDYNIKTHKILNFNVDMLNQIIDNMEDTYDSFSDNMYSSLKLLDDSTTISDINKITKTTNISNLFKSLSSNTNGFEKITYWSEKILSFPLAIAKYIDTMIAENYDTTLKELFPSLAGNIPSSTVNSYITGSDGGSLSTSTIVGLANRNSSYSGSGSGVQSSNSFINSNNNIKSQLDSDVSSIRFNNSKDTISQSIKESGCAPVTASNVVNQVLGSDYLSVKDAADMAISGKYKDIDGGTNISYLSNTLDKYNIENKLMTDRQSVSESVLSGKPTVILGEGDIYGKNGHYMTTTGETDKNGNHIVQDPNSKTGISKYSSKELLTNIKAGISVGNVSGLGNSRSHPTLSGRGVSYNNSSTIDNDTYIYSNISLPSDLSATTSTQNTSTSANISLMDVRTLALDNLSTFTNSIITASKSVQNAQSVKGPRMIPVTKDQWSKNEGTYLKLPHISRIFVTDESCLNSDWYSFKDIRSEINWITHQDLGVWQELSLSDMKEWIKKITNTNTGAFTTSDAQYFIDAGTESGLDPRYIYAHACLETAYGTSSIARDKHNYFGISAFDNSAYASAKSWTSRKEGIIGGAVWIAENYYNNTKYGSQKTVYSMRYNNGSHQYATDPEWHTKIAGIMCKCPDLSDTYAIEWSQYSVEQYADQGIDSIVDYYNNVFENGKPEEETIFTHLTNVARTMLNTVYGKDKVDALFGSSDGTSSSNINGNYTNITPYSADDWFTGTMIPDDKEDTYTRVTSLYNESRTRDDGTSYGHSGIDYANRYTNGGNTGDGPPIYSPVSGVVESVLPTDSSGGYGNYLKLKDNNQHSHIFAHMRDMANYKAGDIISRGQYVGPVGNTGNSTGSHLHYEIRDVSGSHTDPNEYDYAAGETGSLYSGFGSGTSNKNSKVLDIQSNNTTRNIPKADLYSEVNSQKKHAEKIAKTHSRKATPVNSKSSDDIAIGGAIPNNQSYNKMLLSIIEVLIRIADNSDKLSEVILLLKEKSNIEIDTSGINSNDSSSIRNMIMNSIPNSNSSSESLLGKNTEYILNAMQAIAST